MNKLTKYPLTLLALTFHKSGRALMYIGKIFYRIIEARPVDIHTFHPDWDDYASKKEIEEKRQKEEDAEDEGDIFTKYNDWQRAMAMQRRNETLRSMFEGLKQHQLDYFEQYCISEFQQNPYTVSYIVRMIADSQETINVAEIDVELQMHCETNQVFAFVFNLLFEAISNELYPALAAKAFLYDNGLNEELIQAFDYEIKRRFAKSLEIDLPKHDKPKQKRTKI